MNILPSCNYGCQESKDVRDIKILQQFLNVCSYSEEKAVMTLPLTPHQGKTLAMYGAPAQSIWCYLQAGSWEADGQITQHCLHPWTMACISSYARQVAVELKIQRWSNEFWCYMSLLCRGRKIGWNMSQINTELFLISPVIQETIYIC